MRTDETAYAERLVRAQQAPWKRLLDVQRPYRAHLRSLKLGRTLDLGCGIGRNLAALGAEGIGVDHNSEAVEIARRAGFRAFTPDELRSSPEGAPGGFDSLLVAHVVEHMSRDAAVALLREYLGLIRPMGRVVVITPQEYGFRSDPTHVEFMDFARVASMFGALGLELVKQYSFPFPRPFGRVFKYNEFVTIACKRPGRAGGTRA